jgi:hypothetical protein
VHSQIILPAPNGLTSTVKTIVAVAVVVVVKGKRKCVFVCF